MIDQSSGPESRPWEAIKRALLARERNSASLFVPEPPHQERLKDEFSECGRRA